MMEEIMISVVCQQLRWFDTNASPTSIQAIARRPLCEVLGSLQCQDKGSSYRLAMIDSSHLIGTQALAGRYSRLAASRWCLIFLGSQ